MERRTPTQVKSFQCSHCGNPGYLLTSRGNVLCRDCAASTSKLYPLVRKYKKIGRNEPCPCGSGLKYKNCCLK